MRPLLAVAAALLLSAGAASADPVAAPGREIHRVTKDLDFTYRYPAAAGRIPALKAWLAKDAAKQHADIEQRHHQDRYDDISPYKLEIHWLVVTDLSGWLSLSGRVHELAGGAHSNFWPLALLWNKAENRKIKASELFTSPAALSAAIYEPFCDGLNRKRAKKRDELIMRTDPCPDSDGIPLDPVKQVVILGSSDHAHFTRIGILIEPYVAGSFAEGMYEVTLPVTPAVLAAVRPQYRALFALEQPASKNR